LNTTTVLAFAAASCGIAMGLSPLLQLRRVTARRSSADISLGYLGVLLVGFVLWLSYGLAIGNVPLVVSNVVALTSNVLTIAAVLQFREAA
jgi:MtN3 and saliva related transmembrane protein